MFLLNIKIKISQKLIIFNCIILFNIYAEIDKSISDGVLNDFMVRIVDLQTDGIMYYPGGTSSHYLYTNNLTITDKFVDIVHAFISDIDLQNALRKLKTQPRILDKIILILKRKFLKLIYYIDKYSN